MHEVSLAGGIVSLVEAAAAREHFLRVAQLRLEVGALAGVEPQALLFALKAMMPGTCLAGGEITMDEIAAVALCLHCGASTEVASYAEPCSQCGRFTLNVVAGTGLRLLDILVYDD